MISPRENIRGSAAHIFSHRTTSNMTLNQGMIKPTSNTSFENSDIVQDDFATKYLFSMLLCQNLNHVATLQKPSLTREVTNYVLGNTIQFIWHLQLQELTNFSKQK